MRAHGRLSSPADFITDGTRSLPGPNALRPDARPAAASMWLCLLLGAGLAARLAAAGRARRTRCAARAGGAATGRGRLALHVAATAALATARRCGAGAIGARPRLIPARRAVAGRG